MKSTAQVQKNWYWNLYLLYFLMSENFRYKNHRLKSGYYFYTGSARKNPLARISRHLAAAKNIHWQIDHLTTQQSFRPLAVIADKTRPELANTVYLSAGKDRGEIPLIDFSSLNGYRHFKSEVAITESECRLASILAELYNLENAIKNFGASDCRCSGHLYYSSAQPILTTRIVNQR